MLSFTDKVSEALWWFERLHDYTATEHGPTPTLLGLPSPGAIGQQDAWLWEALQHLRTVYTDLHARR